VRERCRGLAAAAQSALAELFDTEPLRGEVGQMVSAVLPRCDGMALKRRLYDEHRVEVPVFPHEGRELLRVSFQGYNDEGDLERLLAGLRALL